MSTSTPRHAGLARVGVSYSAHGHGIRTLCGIALAINGGGVLAAEPELPASMQRNLAIVGIVSLDGPAIFDAVIQSRVSPPPADSGALQPILAAYRKDMQDRNLEVASYKTYQAGRDIALSFLGVPGMAYSGLLRATQDQLLLSAMQSEISERNNLMRATMLSMGDAAWSDVRSKKPGSQDAVKSHARALLNTHASNDLSMAEREAVVESLARFSTESSIENLAAIERIDASVAGLKNLTLASARTLVALKSTVDQLDTKVDALGKSVAGLQGEIEGLKFDKLTSEQQADALRLGALPEVKGDDRKKLVAEVNQKAMIEKTQRVLQQASGTLDGLAVLATVVGNKQAAKTLREVSRAVQYGQATFSVFTAFTTGGPVGGLMAIGGMGGMFGGGASGMREVQAALGEINRKLDKVLELQQRTLYQLSVISHEVGLVSAKIDALSEQLRQSQRAVMQATLKDVYVGCFNLLAGIPMYTPKGREAAFPFRQPSDFVSAHYLAGEWLQRFSGQEGGRCFAELSRLVTQPTLISQAGDLDVQGDEGLKAREDAFRRRLKRLSAYIPSDRQEHMRYLSVPPAETQADAHRKARALRTEGSLSDAEAWKPCLWRRIQDAPCQWLATNNPSPDVLSHFESRLPDAVPLLMASQASLFADLALALYHQPMLPDPGSLQAVRSFGSDGRPVFSTAGDGEAQPSDRTLSREMLRSASLGGSDAKRVLEHAHRLVDISIANHSAHQGELVAEFMADALLAPPQAPDGCAAGDLERGYLVGREAAVYWRYPDLAVRVLNSIMYRLAFFDGALLADSVSSFDTTQQAATALQYDYKLKNAPYDWSYESRDVYNAQTIERAQRYWFKSSLVKDSSKPLNHVRLYYVRPGEKRKIRLEPVKSLSASTPENQPVAFPECRSKDEVLRASPSDASTVELPEGWSIGFGPVVMAMKSSNDLATLRLDPTSELAGLIERRRFLQDERLSFERSTRPSSETARRLIRYGLLGQLERFAERRPISP